LPRPADHDGRHDADDEDQRKYQMLGDLSLIAVESETAGRERFGDHARLQHPPSIEAVRDMSRDQHQQDRRNELRKPDQVEVERATVNA
jgi:hypothetical protein